MPEGERSHAPTPRRLQDLKNNGNVIRSTEFNTAVAMLAAAVTLRFVGPNIVDRMQETLRSTLLHPSALPIDPETIRVVWQDISVLTVGAVAPLFFVAMVTGVMTNLIQVGPQFNSSLLLPKASRIDPLAGFKRLIGTQGWSELTKSVLKIAIIGAVIYHALQDQQGKILMLLRGDPVSGAAWVADLSADVMVRVGVVFLVLAGGDYLFQRWQFMRNARMTLEQVKEETKSTEGSPEMRSRMRQYARTLAMGRMMAAVPTADVIITNPTHLAIAIKYEMGNRAPRVIAKGPNLLAERIKQIAREKSIPIIENRPLAQALYKAVEVGQEVPAQLFQVVAEVLAFVYRLKAPRTNMRMA